VTQPEIHPGALLRGQEFNFNATFEILPEVEFEEADFEGLQITVPPAAVAEAEVDARLEQMREADGQLRPVEDRSTAASGDLVTFDYSMSVAGGESDEQTGRSAELGADHLIPEMEEALQGATVGEPRQFEMSLPETHPNPELAGKTASFEVTLREIKEKILPDLDDEWARDHDHDSLAELRAKVEADLAHHKQLDQDGKIHDALLDAIIERKPFDIPPGLAQREIDQRMQSIERMFGGSSPDELRESIRRSTRDRVYTDLRRAVVLSAIVRREGITVDDAALAAKIEEKVAHAAEHHGQPIAKVRAQYASEEARDGVRSELESEQALAFLKARATILEEEPAPVAPEAPAASPENEASDPS